MSFLLGHETSRCNKPQDCEQISDTLEYEGKSN